MDEWVRVEDRLPDLKVEVLAWERPWGYYLAHRTERPSGFGPDRDLTYEHVWETTPGRGSESGGEIIHPTHWMLLPDPPEEPNQ